MPAYLRPSGEIADAAVLPGDPARAMALARELLAAPRMVNHARGLWGYSGATSTGAALTVQAAGIGGPSAAAVLRDLAELGTGCAIRVGACTAVGEEVGPGELLVTARVLPCDGASRALGASDWIEPAGDLTAALATALGGRAHPASIASVDLLGGPEAEREHARARAAGAVAVDHSSAALIALGKRLGVAVSSCLVVSEAGSERFDERRLESAMVALGRAAAGALDAAAGERHPRRQVEG